jgi:hypothetical protein
MVMDSPYQEPARRVPVLPKPALVWKVNRPRYPSASAADWVRGKLSLLLLLRSKLLCAIDGRSSAMTFPDLTSDNNWRSVSGRKMTTLTRVTVVRRFEELDSGGLQVEGRSIGK